MQKAQPKSWWAGGMSTPWVFRFWLCRWCRAARLRTEKHRYPVLPWRSDAEVIEEAKKHGDI